MACSSSKPGPPSLKRARSEDVVSTRKVKKPRSNGSIVWELFEVDPTDNTKAICQTCGESKSRGGKTSSTFTTSGLLAHAQVCNPNEVKRLQAQKINKLEKEQNTPVLFKYDAAPFGSSSLSKLAQPTVTAMFKAKEQWGQYHPKAIEEHRKLGEMVAKSHLGYNTLHSDGIKDYIEDKTPQYTIPSRKFMANRVVPAIALGIKKHIMKLILLADYINFTSDTWTARYTSASFISLTAHFMERDTGRFQCYVLHTKYFPESHTASNISNIILNMLKEYNIPPEKVHGIITDNAANI